MTALALLLAATAAAGVDKAAAERISVQIEFVEAIAPRDSTSSTRYQQSYEGTISLGSELLAQKLKSCGYRFATRTAFYDASDALKAKELGERATAEGAWLVVGPRRSNHYLLLVQGAESIQTASIMASSDKVGQLGLRHVTLAPTNSKMATTAALEAQRRTKRGARYVSIVSSDCSNCIDFARSFDRTATKFGLKKVDELLLTGEMIQPADLRDRVFALRPDFVLLPNYSKVSSAVMAAFNEVDNPPLFVGGDGWGDSQYGFVQNGLDIQKIKGITVRGFPPEEKALSLFPLGRRVQKERRQLTFTPDLSILKVMDVAADALCAERPKSRSEFLSVFEKRYADKINAPWGISIFELKRGGIHFYKTVGSRK